jgi:hypothetical protein
LDGIAEKTYREMPQAKRWIWGYAALLDEKAWPPNRMKSDDDYALLNCKTPGRWRKRLCKTIDLKSPSVAIHSGIDFFHTHLIFLVAESAHTAR